MDYIQLVVIIAVAFTSIVTALNCSELACNGYYSRYGFLECVYLFFNTIV